MIDAQHSDKQPVVLVFVRTYLPGYKSGGPVRTIANMVQRLGADVRFLVVASDRDVLDPAPYADIDTYAWNMVGQTPVYYVPPRWDAARSIARMMRRTRYDVLYLNSFFDLTYTLVPLLLHRLGIAGTAPVVVAPRGEFSPAALTIKAWRKALYLALFTTLRLCRRITWQASSEDEARDIRRALSSHGARVVVAPVVVAPDLSPPEAGPASGNAPLRPRGPLRVVTMSRVAPIKNLHFAIEVLAEASVPVRFDIFGLMDDSAYWRRCEALIADLPGHVEVRYRGVLEHGQVRSALASYDLFLLPTQGENYGHAIFEALEAGLPVLISDRTPWRGLEERGVGWDLPLSDPGGFVEKINGQAAIGELERRAQWDRCRQYAVSVTASQSAAASNLALFMDLLDHAGRGQLPTGR